MEGLNFFNPEDIKGYPFNPEAAFTNLVALNFEKGQGENPGWRQSK